LCCYYYYYYYNYIFLLLSFFRPLRVSHQEKKMAEPYDTSPSGGGDDDEDNETRGSTTPRARGRPWSRAKAGSIYLPGENKLTVTQNKHDADCQRILTVATHKNVNLEGEPSRTTEGDEYVLTVNSLLYEGAITVAAREVGPQWLVKKETRFLPDKHMSSIKKQQETLILMCYAKAAPRIPMIVYVCAKGIGVIFILLGVAILLWMLTIPLHAGGVGHY
jgi:hypothetical protein